jgi:molybdate transport system permease protein
MINGSLVRFETPDFAQPSVASSGPLLAVVIPVYKHSVLLEEAVISALDQETVFEICVVIVNDGCPMDETHQACLGFAAAVPNRIHYIRRPNGGLSAARNTGIDHVLSTWETVRAVYFLDADNRLLPGALQRAHDALAEVPEAAWIYPDVDMFGQEWNSDYSGEYSVLRHLDENICEAGSLVRREVFEKDARFDESMRLGFEDWDFWLGAIELGFRGKHLENCGFRYRRRARRRPLCPGPAGCRSTDPAGSGDPEAAIGKSGSPPIPRLSRIHACRATASGCRPGPAEMIEALALTIRLALVTTALLVCAAIPMAAWIVFTPSRLRPLVEAITTLPLLLPPTVLGFYLLVLLGPKTAFGRMWIAFTGHPLAFSFSGLVVGSVIYSLPFAVQPLVAGFSGVDPALLDQARLLGGSRVLLLRRVLLPLSARSVMTACVLCFMHTVGEFGVVLMIGGNIPGATRTLSILIYDQVQDFAYAQANRTALLLVVISLGALVLLYSQRRTVLSEARRV